MLAGAGFVFAVLAWRRDNEGVAQDEDAATRDVESQRRAAWFSCFLIVLAAGFGDLTQLATAALAAQTPAQVAGRCQLARRFGKAGGLADRTPAPTE